MSGRPIVWACLNDADGGRTWRTAYRDEIEDVAGTAVELRYAPGEPGGPWFGFVAQGSRLVHTLAPAEIDLFKERYALRDQRGKEFR